MKNYVCLTLLFCVILLIGCKKDNVDISGKGRVVYEGVSYPLEYATKITSPAPFRAIIDDKQIQHIEHKLILESANRQNKVMITFYTLKSELTTDMYALRSLEINTVENSAIQVNMYLADVNDGIDVFIIHMDYTNKGDHRCAFETGSTEDKSGFRIEWDGFLKEGKEE